VRFCGEWRRRRRKGRRRRGRSKVEEEEGKVAATSFMSEAGGFYLGSVGLLGEYCPTTRKRQKPLLDCRSSPGGGRLHVVAKLHWCQRKRSTTSVTTSIAAVS
jgi:hypothetical protein